MSYKCIVQNVSNFCIVCFKGGTSGHIIKVMVAYRLMSVQGGTSVVVVVVILAFSLEK